MQAKGGQAGEVDGAGIVPRSGPHGDALALNHLAWADVQVSAVSLTCAAGVLAITQRAPAFAGCWELARSPYWLFPQLPVAAFAAHGLRLLREQHRAERRDIVA